MAAHFSGTQAIGSKLRRHITSVDTCERPERSPAAARWGSAPPALFLHLPRLWFRVLTHRAVPPPQHRPRCCGPPVGSVLLLALLAARRFSGGAGADGADG